MAIVLSMSNFKGGAGKTTSTMMTAYKLAEMGRKVLVLDLDSQANLSSIFLKTERAAWEHYEKFVNDEGKKDSRPVIYRNKDVVAPVIGYMLDAVETGSFLPYIRTVTDNLSDNLHYVPNSDNFKDFDMVLEDIVPGAKKKVYEKRLQYFKQLVDEVRPLYDYIFIDVPPTNSIYTDVTFYSCDFVLVVLQTQRLALDGVTSIHAYLREFVQRYQLRTLEIVGILRVILRKESVIEQIVSQQALEYFGEEHLFTSEIRYSERLKRYSGEGIVQLDHHDKNVLAVFEELVNELEQRLVEFGVTL